MIELPVQGFELEFPSWHGMDRWDEGIAPGVLRPNLVGKYKAGQPTPKGPAMLGFSKSVRRPSMFSFARSTFRFHQG